MALPVLALLGHVDHGKSTLVAALGHRLNPEAKITSRLFAYLGPSYVLVDTPGHECFSKDRELALAACDGVVVVADARRELAPMILEALRASGARSKVVGLVLTKTDLGVSEAQADLRVEELAEAAGRAFRTVRAPLEPAALASFLASLAEPLAAALPSGRLALVLGPNELKGLGAGLEVLLLSDGLPDSFYLGEGRLELVRLVREPRRSDFLNPVSSSAPSFLKASPAASLEAAGAFLTLAPSRHAPLLTALADRAAGGLNFVIRADS